MLFPALNSQPDCILLAIFASLAMQQDHQATIDPEIGPRLDPAALYRGAHLANAVSDRAASRHADGPTKLDCGNIRTDGMASCLSSAFSHSFTGSTPSFVTKNVATIRFMTHPLYLIRFILANFARNRHHRKMRDWRDLSPSGTLRRNSARMKGAE
jgi:hypothetical protein